MTIELHGLGWMGGVASGVPQVRTHGTHSTHGTHGTLRTF